MTAEHAAAESEQQVANMLGNLLRSNQFPEWLEAAALDTLVADASVRLAELSNGQFELTHRNGEFFVIDHADADSQRGVRTLSGGETFQASLALALALSTQLSSMAAAGAARLDSIFLDEGFGTLDESTLEIVAATLESLAQGTGWSASSPTSPRSPSGCRSGSWSTGTAERPAFPGRRHDDRTHRQCRRVAPPPGLGGRG